MNSDNTNNITPNETSLQPEAPNTSQGCATSCQEACSEDVQSCTCSDDPSCDFCHWGDAHLRGFAAKGCGRSDHQLNSYDYLADIPGNEQVTDFVEVQFKNTRKGFYRNDNHLDLQKGDIVAVEAQPGHDIGTVSLTGKLALLQMQKANLKPGFEIKRVYRKARPADIEKYEEAKAREHDTMIRSRQIAKDLALQMKIGDVEYQGDGNKAIFYYIADARVDFRKLIKVLAEAFRVRIEMKQIGARQEAGRIGGIGPCGRELCCATWMKNFSSVSTAAARFQDITPNPQKLAGQCAKLKCCLNYEVDTYMEAARKLPERHVTLDTVDGTYYCFKVDTLAGLITYSTDRRLAANLVTITAERAHEVIEMNAAGEKPESLLAEGPTEPARPVDLAEQDDLTRFDKARSAKSGRGGNRRRGGGYNNRTERSERPERNAQNAERTERGNRRDRGERQQRDRRDRRDGNNNSYNRRRGEGGRNRNAATNAANNDNKE